MRKRLFGALVAVLCLSVAGVAYAQTAGQTTSDLSIKVSPTKAGTKKKPKPVNFTLGIKGGVKNGGTQPAQPKSLNTTFPKDLTISGKGKWPKKYSCNLATMLKDKSAKSCPAKSKVGSGTSNAVANGGAFKESIVVTAYALDNGSVGFFLKGDPVGLFTTLEGKIVKSGHGLNVIIPKSVSEPAPGFKTGITSLNVKFTGKVKGKVKGKTRTIGAVESTGCSGGKWKFKFDDVVFGGVVSAKDEVKCKK